MKLLLTAVLGAVVVAFAPAHAGGPGACLGSDLAARPAFQGGTGAQEGGVTLRNRSGHSCVLAGRAIVDFSAGAGPLPLPVRVVVGRATDGRRRDRTIVLAPGRRAFVHARGSNGCGRRYEHVTVRLWLRSVEPRVHVRGAISPPRCDDAAVASRVAVGPYERVRVYRP